MCDSLPACIVLATLKSTSSPLRHKMKNNPFSPCPGSCRRGHRARARNPKHPTGVPPPRALADSRGEEDKNSKTLDNHHENRHTYSAKMEVARMISRQAMQVYLSVDLKEWLRGYAETHDLTMTTVIKILVERERGRVGGRGGRPLVEEPSDARRETRAAVRGRE